MEVVTFSSIPEQFKDVTRFKNFPDMQKNFLPLLTHDLSEHVMIKLCMNNHNFVLRQDHNKILDGKH